MVTASYDGAERTGEAVRAEGYIADAAFIGTLTNQYGLFSRVGINSGSGTVTNSYGLYIQNLHDTGTVINPYGVYQATTNAKNYFAGNVGIGTMNPSQKLDVAGSIAIGTGGQILSNGAYLIRESSGSTACPAPSRRTCRPVPD